MSTAAIMPESYLEPSAGQKAISRGRRLVLLLLIASLIVSFITRAAVQALHDLESSLPHDTAIVAYAAPLQIRIKI